MMLQLPREPICPAVVAHTGDSTYRRGLSCFPKQHRPHFISFYPTLQWQCCVVGVFWHTACSITGLMHVISRAVAVLHVSAAAKLAACWGSQHMFDIHSWLTRLLDSGEGSYQVATLGFEFCKYNSGSVAGRQCAVQPDHLRDQSVVGCASCSEWCQLYVHVTDCAAAACRRLDHQLSIASCVSF